MPNFEEDEDLFEMYQKYVISNSGIPEDYDTWVQTAYGESRKRPHKQKNNNNNKYYEM